MIDAARPGEVGVIVMEGTLDVAAMGNLMGTAATARGMAGMVLDGGIRDIWDIRRMGLTVYARSATAHRGRPLRDGGEERPGECAGVRSARATSSSLTRTGSSSSRRNARRRS